jgi:hypothetical protein
MAPFCLSPFCTPPLTILAFCFHSAILQNAEWNTVLTTLYRINSAVTEAYVNCRCDKFVKCQSEPEAPAMDAVSRASKASATQS